jgi:glucose/arabinose dehydrogenase
MAHEPPRSSETDDEQQTTDDTTATTSSSSRLPITSRRRFLGSAGALGVLGTVGGVTLAQQDQPATTFKLDGKTSGWQGRAPSAISGTVNPTLNVTAGQKYKVTWANVDGAPHNFVILDANGNQLKRTKIISKQGATQTLTFTASEQMAEYLCEVHPTTMVGQMNVSGTQQQANQTTQTPTPTDQSQGGGGMPQPYFPSGPTVGVKTVGEGLAAPTDWAIAKEKSNRKFVTDQTGQVWVLGKKGFQDEPFLDVEEKMIYIGNDYDERGLLGIEFHPNFQKNRKFYIHYSAPVQEGTPVGYSHTSVFAEYRATEDLSTGKPQSERVLLEIPHPQSNHDAGPLAFGPDGYLYIPMGDGGGADDADLGHVTDWYSGNEGGNGQDVKQNLLGSILRIDVDSQGGVKSKDTSQHNSTTDTKCTAENHAEKTPSAEKAYGIPEDNPLVGKEGLNEHYAWGFRNPWRFSFNDGNLYVGDVGQNLFEEIDIVEKGGNYGWNVREGTHCFNTKQPENPLETCPMRTPANVRGGEQLLDPIIEYPHTYMGASVGVAVIGGYVYGTSAFGTVENVAVSELEGMYVFGEYAGQPGSPSGRLFVGMPGDRDAQMGNEGGNQTAGNQTGGGMDTDIKKPLPGAGDLWYTQELQIEGPDGGEFSYYVRGFGRDHKGELYVLASKSNLPVGNTGTVFKIVPPE